MAITPLLSALAGRVRHRQEQMEPKVLILFLAVLRQKAVAVVDRLGLLEAMAALAVVVERRQIQLFMLAAQELLALLGRDTMEEVAFTFPVQEKVEVEVEVPVGLGVMGPQLVELLREEAVLEEMAYKARPLLRLMVVLALAGHLPLDIFLVGVEEEVIPKGLLGMVAAVVVGKEAPQQG